MQPSLRHRPPGGRRLHAVGRRLLAIAHGAGVYRGRATRSLAALALSIIALPAAADPRLESVSFGNMGPLAYRGTFPAMSALLVEGRTVPGLRERFVPQGLEHLDDGERVVISGYFCEAFQRAPWYGGFIRRCVRKQSGIYLYNLAEGEAERLALLETREGEPLRWHAGGVAVLYDKLWVPDNFRVARFDLRRLTDAAEPVIRLAPENETRIGVDSSGDFITAHRGALWIGNFQRGGRGEPLPAHYASLEAGTAGWTAAYRIDPDTLRPRNTERYQVRWGGRDFEVYRPDTALHHRSIAQGMSFIGERRLVISASWGDSPSAFSFHLLPDEPLARQEEGPTVTLPDGHEIPIWAAHDATREIRLNGAPGSEGISYDGRFLMAVFEGGAMPYRQRWGRLEDRMLRFVKPGITQRSERDVGPTPQSNQ